LRQARRILPIAFAETSGGLSEDYTTEMQEKMGGSLTYEHDRGMNYTRILDGTRSHPGLIVGSCLQTPEDAERLRNDEKVRAVLCLQQDKDMAYFDLDIMPVLGGCEAVGIDHFRSRVNDFDPHDLRLRLPDAAAALERDRLGVVLRGDLGEAAHVEGGEHPLHDGAGRALEQREQEERGGAL